MRSGIALAAAAWFAIAAILNGTSPGGGDLDVVVQAIHAVAQTLFVGLTILCLAMVDSREVVAFFDVKPTTSPAADEGPTEE
jgi:hypothetical protein